MEIYRPLPTNRGQAKRLSIRRYRDAGNPCLICKHPDPIRYTAGNECQHCTDTSERIRYEFTPAKSQSQALELGLDSYTTDRLCKNGPHLKERSVRPGDHRCVACIRDHKNGKGLRLDSRKVARERGEWWYIPDEPCKHCGTLSQRHVQDNRCKGCKVKRKQERDRARNVILRIKRGDAKALGFHFYLAEQPCKNNHPPIRYTSTGGCVACQVPERAQRLMRTHIVKF